MTTPLSLPAAFSAWKAPAAAGWLMVWTTLMSGLFCRQLSIAVWPLAWSPKLSAMQTISALLENSLLLASAAAVPQPDMRPL